MYVDNVVANIVPLITGRSSRRPFRFACHAGGRSATLLADAEAPTSHTVQADPDPAGAAGAGYPAVGRQLRASVRLYLRLLGGLRADAIYLVRPLRPQTEDPADLGMSDPDRGPVRPAARPLLQRTGVRVRGVQTVQLRAVHPRLLRLPEHQFQAGGAGMTHGAAVHSRARNCSARPPTSRSSSSRASPQYAIAVRRARSDDAPRRLPKTRPKPQDRSELNELFRLKDNSQLESLNYTKLKKALSKNNQKGFLKKN